MPVEKGKISCLALWVMTGLLQSLADASPSCMGQSFFCHVYNAMYTTQAEGSETLHPHHCLYLITLLTDDTWSDLIWWGTALMDGASVHSSVTRITFPSTDFTSVASSCRFLSTPTQQQLTQRPSQAAHFLIVVHFYLTPTSSSVCCVGRIRGL